MDSLKAWVSLGGFALALLAPMNASALQLGIQDHDAPPAQMNGWAAETGATWERLIVDLGDPTAADKIRASHAAGRKVILTVGGLGTRTRRPGFALALRYIDTLPRVEKYTIGNEPDMDGIKPCVYRRGWMLARRTLGKRLLWGDFSPIRPITFTRSARRCGHLPDRLDVAVHPYQWNDPFAPPGNPRWREGGMGNLRRLKQAIGARSLWLTEFGYTAAVVTPDGRTVGGVPDDQAAWLWPRALARASQVGAKVLVVYTAQGPTWDTRPREQAWAAIRNAIEGLSS